MPRRDWKRVRPNSHRQAVELCLQHARERHNRSVDRVADLMGLANKWSIYKWMESGRMPAVLIAPFESACGIRLVSQHIAHTARLLTFPIPTGKRAEHRDLNDLSLALNEAVNTLIRFHAGEADGDATLGALGSVMEDLAFQLHNVQKANQPELEFEAPEDE